MVYGTVLYEHAVLAIRANLSQDEPGTRAAGQSSAGKGPLAVQYLSCSFSFAAARCSARAGRGTL